MTFFARSQVTFPFRVKAKGSATHSPSGNPFSERVLRRVTDQVLASSPACTTVSLVFQKQIGNMIAVSKLELIGPFLLPKCSPQKERWCPTAHGADWAHLTVFLAPGSPASHPRKLHSHTCLISGQCVHLF